MEQAIPCILHMENRCGEKIIKMLLINALEMRDGISNRDKEIFFKEFENIINTQIIGNQLKPSQWKISKNDQQGYLIGSISLNNRTTRKIINGIENLILMSIVDVTVKDKWLKTIKLYRDMIEILRQKEDFTDEEINEYQNLADEFFKCWLDLHGKDGVTNYFHMIGSGHLTYYLKKWRNLYRYSQQGWESLNNLIKVYYFRRTQRGGYAHDSNGRSTSKIVPIAKWIQRCIMWKLNIAI